MFSVGQSERAAIRVAKDEMRVAVGFRVWKSLIKRMMLAEGLNGPLGRNQTHIKVGGNIWEIDKFSSLFGLDFSRKIMV